MNFICSEHRGPKVPNVLASRWLVAYSHMRTTTYKSHDGLAAAVILAAQGLKVTQGIESRSLMVSSQCIESRSLKVSSQENSRSQGRSRSRNASRRRRARFRWRRIPLIVLRSWPRNRKIMATTAASEGPKGVITSTLRRAHHPLNAPRPGPEAWRPGPQAGRTLWVMHPAGW